VVGRPLLPGQKRNPNLSLSLQPRRVILRKVPSELENPQIIKRTTQPKKTSRRRVVIFKRKDIPHPYPRFQKKKRSHKYKKKNKSPQHQKRKQHRQVFFSAP